MKWVGGFGPPPVPTHIFDVIRRLKTAGYPTYLVGGCVRDMILKKEPKDWDVTTAATPDQVKALFKRVIPTGIKFGTVTVLTESPVEVTTFRSDGDYTDGRRPDTVKFSTSIEEDLARRDFTMNAIAFDPIEGDLKDPWEGCSDIEDRLIRCVGDPISRFNEDRLRVLRAIRFAITLGFDISVDTLDAVTRVLCDDLDGVAQERRTAEFMKCLGTRQIEERFLEFIVDIDGAARAFGVGHADEQWGYGLRVRGLDRIDPTLPVVRLAHLYSEYDDTSRIEESLRGMRQPNDFCRVAAGLVGFMHRALQIRHAWSAEIRQLISDCVVARISVDDLITLLKARDISTTTIDKLERLWNDNQVFTQSSLTLNGRDVGRITGLQGPEIGRALQYLLHEVIDDPTRNNPETLTRILHTEFRR